MGRTANQRKECYQDNRLYSLSSRQPDAFPEFDNPKKTTAYLTLLNRQTSLKKGDLQHWLRRLAFGSTVMKFLKSLIYIIWRYIFPQIKKSFILHTILTKISLSAGSAGKQLLASLSAFVTIQACLWGTWVAGIANLCWRTDPDRFSNAWVHLY